MKDLLLTRPVLLAIVFGSFSGGFLVARADWRAFLAIGSAWLSGLFVGFIVAATVSVVWIGRSERAPGTENTPTSPGAVPVRAPCPRGVGRTGDR